jgi:hypothetical protein
MLERSGMCLPFVLGDKGHETQPLTSEKSAEGPQVGIHELTRAPGPQVTHAPLL